MNSEGLTKEEENGGEEGLSLACTTGNLNSGEMEASLAAAEQKEERWRLHRWSLLLGRWKTQV